MSKEILEKLKKGLSNKHLSDAQRKSIKAKIESLEKLDKKSEPKAVKKVVAPKKVEKVVSKKAKEAKPKKEVKVSAATKKEMKRHKQGRSKSDLARDAKRSALKGGKRISAEGNVYYENRPNRSDVNPRTRFEKGGSVEGDKYIVVNEKMLAVTMPNRFNNTKGTDEAEVLAVKPSEIGFTKIGDVFFLKGKKARPATSEDFDAYKVVEPKGSKSDYKIVTGFDHKNNHELYHVVGIDNDYVGEYHKNKKDAEAELKDLNGSKFEEGGNIEEEDLFENYDALPENVRNVLDEHLSEENDYETLQKLEEELKPLGYTFDYGLDAVPMNLRKIEKFAKGGITKSLATGYTHFAVEKSSGKILNGWDYKGYDKEELNSEKKHYFYDDVADIWDDIKKSEYTIQTREQLKKKGVEVKDSANWKKQEMAEGGNISDIKIKDWYTKYFKEDELGEELNKKSTFKDLLNAIEKGKDVYAVLGVSDSVIRERAFSELSRIEKKGGQWAYNTWLSNDSETEAKFAKGGSIATCPVGTKIQTIIFSKEFFNKTKAVKWLDKNNFKGTIADDKSTTVRFRQASPDKFKEDTFRTIELTKGVKAVIGCPKK